MSEFMSSPEYENDGKPVSWSKILKGCENGATSRTHEVDGVVHHRAAARELGVEEPTARDLTAVRAAYGQHATQGSAANDLPRAGHRGEVAYWKSRPEHAARVLGGLVQKNTAAHAPVSVPVIPAEQEG